jgi:hypothetical protein
LLHRQRQYHRSKELCRENGALGSDSCRKGGRRRHDAFWWECLRLSLGMVEVRLRGRRRAFAMKVECVCVGAETVALGLREEERERGRGGRDARCAPYFVLIQSGFCFATSKTLSYEVCKSPLLTGTERHSEFNQSSSRATPSP